MGNTHVVPKDWKPVPYTEDYTEPDNPEYPGVPPYWTLNSACKREYWPGWQYYNTGYHDRVRFLHGWLAVFAWSFLGSIMIISNRYLSGFIWRFFFWIHAIAGTLLYLVNFVSCYYVWYYSGFGVAH